MRNTTRRKHCTDGTIMRAPVNNRNLLNLNILDLLNRTHRCGSLDMPELTCNTSVFPDFLALYKEPSLYRRTPMSGVCFYEFDHEFDGRNGLYWAIYFNDKARLDYFRERFKDVRFIITPDYSVFGDIHQMENLYRIWRARIVALWFIFEIRAIVIPSISYATIDSFPLFFSGIEKCTVVCFSTKGHVKNSRERSLFLSAIRYAVDNLPLKAIVVYSVCGNDATCLEMFKYASDRGIHIHIPDNTLRSRNMRRGG